MPPKKQAPTKANAGSGIFDMDRIRSVMVKDVPEPKATENEARVWVEAFCPASVSNGIFGHWRETAEEAGAVLIGVIGEYAPTTLSPNGYWCNETRSLHLCFPSAAVATEWGIDQCPAPFSFRIQPPNVDPEEDPAWAYYFPHIEIAPSITDTTLPEVVLRIQGSHHRPVSSETWDMVIRTLDQLSIVGHVRDERTDEVEVMIPVCHESQAQALQATLIGQLPEELLVDLILPAELGSERCYLAVSVQSASTGAGAPPDHRLLDSMIEAVRCTPVGHAGDPNSCDPENPFHSVMGFRSIRWALLFRVMWRQLRIGGDTLLWNLHGAIVEKDPIPTRIGSKPSGLKRGRASSPTSGSDQGRVKRKRQEGGKPRNSKPGSGTAQGGHGHSPLDPIKLIPEDHEMLAPISPPVDLNKAGQRPSQVSDIKTSDLGFPINGTVSLYIEFPGMSSADSWRARYDKLPFYVSVLKKKDDPTKEVGWQPGMPCLENSYEPEVVIRVTAKNGRTTMDDRKRWIAQLTLFGILAFNNHADNSVWIPARTFAAGEKFWFLNWTKNGSWIAETTAVVVEIPRLQMEHAHLGITKPAGHPSESSQQRHKGLQNVLWEFFRDRLETVDECLATSGQPHHTAVSFKTVSDAVKCAVVWHGVWPDFAECFLRGPVNQGAATPPRPLANAHRQHNAAPPPARRPVFTVEDETDEGEEDSPFHDEASPLQTPEAKAVFTVEDETDEEEEDLASPDEKFTKPARVEVLIPPLLNLAPAGPEEVEKIKAESRTFIHSWFAIHKATVPTDDEIQQVLDLLPDTPLWYSALSTARQNKGNSIHALITAISEWTMECDKTTIGPTSPTIYIASVQAVTGCIDDLCSRIGNVNGTQRARMQKEMTSIAEDLSAAGHGPDYIVSLLYAGSTWNLGRRSRLDAKKFQFKGTPSQDRRQPLIVAETIAGGATTKRDCSFVCLKPNEGGAFLNGYSDTILGPDGQIRRDEDGNIKFPAVCRLPVISILHAPRHLWHLLEAIVAALCSPAQLNIQLGGLARHRLDRSMVELLKSRVSLGADAEVLFLGDATGIKGRSFGDSLTGHLFVLMVEDYTGQKHITIRLSDWHSADRHESNDDEITPDDVKNIKKTIKDDDLVICLFGAGVSGKSAWKYLFDVDDVPPLDETPFFEPFTAKVLGKRRVIILLPHIGVLNHVGELDWIIQSFADAIPITLMLGTFAKTVKADSSIPPPSAAAAVLDLYRESEVCDTFSRRLEWPKLRSFWNGKTAPRVQRLLDEGVAWNKIYPAVAKELKMSVVLTLGVSDPDATPILIPKQGVNDRDVYFHISVPPLQGEGRYEVEDMWIPQQFRAEDDYYATLQLHPETLHLQLVKADGTLANSTNGNPFSISRSHWMSSLTYNGRAIKAHAERLGIWRPLSVAESRLITYFKRFIEKGGDAKNTWTKMRCVQTLDEDEIRRGVSLGEPYLHPISDSFKFRFWDGDVDFLHLKKNPKKDPTAWEVAQFKKDRRPAGVRWVAPILDKQNPSNWRFLMYGCSESNTPCYLGRSASWSATSRWKYPWPILNGARKTFLYKKTYPDKR